MSKRVTNLTKDEIISLYLRAKHKEEEVVILSQLTASDTDTILEILKDAGVYSGAYGTCARCGYRFPSLTTRKKYCWKCAETQKRISRLKQMIKQNNAKILEAQRWNAQYRMELDKLEIEFEN